MRSLTKLVEAMRNDVVFAERHINEALPLLRSEDFNGRVYYPVWLRLRDESRWLLQQIQTFYDMLKRGMHAMGDEEALTLKYNFLQKIMVDLTERFTNLNDSMQYVYGAEPDTHIRSDLYRMLDISEHLFN